MYNWYLEVLRDRVWSRFELWTFEELTDLKPDYRQDWLSHPFLGFHCQLTFFSTRKFSLGTDIQMKMKLQRTKTEFWVYQIPVELSACLNSVEYCSKEILNTKISTSSNEMLKLLFNQTKMKQMTKNSRLLFFVVDPCKESTQMNTKKTLIYNWIAVDHLRWSTRTQRKESIQICNCGIQKRTQNTNCGLRKAIYTEENTKFVADHWGWSTRHKSRADSGSNQRKSGILLKENSTQNGCTQNDCGS